MPYKTVGKAATYSQMIEKSEFIAAIAPVTTSEEAAAFIVSVRAEHRRARHNCYAYTLREGGETRFSDDGEPQGTAGQPILEVIKKTGLSDVCIVVTRYFGGILLGKGGLTRAYSSSASGAVSEAVIKLMCDAREVSLELDYTFYDRIQRLISEHRAKVAEQNFTDAVTLKLYLRDEDCEPFLKDVRESSNGKISAQVSDVFFADFA